MVRSVREAHGPAIDVAGDPIVRKVADRKPRRGAQGSDAERQARREVRRAELVEAAVAVIRREGPGASMDQMAAEAGVTKPILYRHFRDRSGLVAAIGEHALELVISALDSALTADVAPRELVASTIDAYLQFIESDASLYRFIVRQTVAETGEPGAALDQYIARAGRQVALVLGEGLRAAGLDSGAAEPWAFGIVGMVHAAGDWWMERATMPRIRLSRYLAELVCDGLPDALDVGTTGSWISPAAAASTTVRASLTIPASPDTPGTTNGVPDPASADRVATAAGRGRSDPATGTVTSLATKQRRTS